MELIRCPTENEDNSRHLSDPPDRDCQRWRVAGMSYNAPLADCIWLACDARVAQRADDDCNHHRPVPKPRCGYYLPCTNLKAQSQIKID